MENMLTIDKICGYLPYGLKIMNGWGDIDVLRPIHLEKISPIVFVPILYDISCLTEEIEVNGERFVPIVDLLKIHQKEWYDYHINSKYSEIEYQHSPNVIKASFTFMASLSVIVLPKELHSEPYWVIQKLYEWHIDIHGLIPAGLAIDKKTLK